MFEKMHAFLKRYQYIILHLGMAFFYLLFFYVICESSYSADDIFNANAPACNYIEGNSVWKLTIQQWEIWFNNGRFYPFSNYTYLLFSILPNRFCYKLLILISVYINSLLMSKCIEKITGSKSAGLLAMLLFPFSLQLTPRYDGPLYCYHMLIQVVMLGSEIAMLTVFRYWDQKDSKKHCYWYLIVGALAYTIALGTYEVAFIMAAFLGLGAWAYTGSVKNSLKALVPNIVAFTVMLCLNIVFRIRPTQATYDGTSINFQPKAVFITFAKQLYSTFPYSGFIDERYNQIPWSMPDWLKELRIQDIFMILVFIVLTWIIMQDLIQNIGKIQALHYIVFMGISLMVFPSILISLMTKYQNELWFGRGHISNYIQNFGFMLVLLSIVILILQRANKRLQTGFTIVCITLGIPFLLGQQMEARTDVEYRYLLFGYCRDIVYQACDHRIFEDIESQDIVFCTSDYIYDSADTKSFYTNAAKKEIQAMGKAQIMPILTEHFGLQATYELWNTEQEYYATTMVADANGSYMLLGQIHTIEVTEDGSSYTTIMVEDPKLFSTGQPTIDLKGWTVLNQTKEGTMYTYSGLYVLP